MFHFLEWESNPQPARIPRKAPLTYTHNINTKPIPVNRRPLKNYKHKENNVNVFLLRVPPNILSVLFI